RGLSVIVRLACRLEFLFQLGRFLLACVVCLSFRQRQFTLQAAQFASCLFTASDSFGPRGLHGQFLGVLGRRGGECRPIGGDLGSRGSQSRVRRQQVELGQSRGGLRFVNRGFELFIGLGLFAG